MFDLLDHYRVNELHVRDDAATGLKSFIAIHNTRFGPALGGCRFISYTSPDDALLDALRLARGMSYKAVLAGVPQGGGKSVIMKPKGQFDAEAIFRSFGRFVDDLGGRYITAIDSGTTAKEMDWISKETRHVTSTSSEDNPSNYTARGVFEGLKAAVRHKLGQDRLNGIRVAVQGIGNVGYQLCHLLHEAGASLIVSDINQEAIKRAHQDFGATVVSVDEIYSVECDVFAPCGLGSIINDQTLSLLKCAVVAGSANNQLKHHEHGQWLHDEGILYSPDYVINAGGLVYASLHHLGKPQHLIEEKTKRIAHTLSEIFKQSEQKDLATSVIADQLAEQRLYQKLSEAA
ncbi:amino acid dehydrogenase [Hahella sp. CCB-MM4]|uniref:Leu/Phe/Val dehydrogenase n=1 Tax=Hahella sp. (strain CCB-MM4) TaxID=1926491 RepID=UPI000B9BB07A|nr:amino acid dehydrogenase [Hahella sp. CCB-MM4]OZG74609.1 amino acid dehydrogenase [Hahella sp. CCB-MM4]